MRQVAACGVAQHDSHVRSAMRRLRAELAPSKACVYQTITRQVASRTTDVKCLQVSHHQAEATREISHTTRHSTRSDSRPGRYGILTVYETGYPGAHKMGLYEFFNKQPQHHSCASLYCTHYCGHGETRRACGRRVGCRVHSRDLLHLCVTAASR